MKILLLVLGLLIGGAAGWFTAPQPAAQVDIGPVSVEVDRDQEGGSVTASDGDRSVEIAVGDQSMLDDRTTRTGIFAVGGGIIGLLLGFVFGRSRPA